MMSVGERVNFGRIDARDRQPIAAVVVSHAHAIARCRVRDFDGCPVVNVRNRLDNRAMVFHVNPLNCAAAATRRVFTTAVAITVENSITELDRIADAVMLLLFDKHGFPRRSERDHVTGLDGAPRASALARKPGDHAEYPS